MSTVKVLFTSDTDSRQGGEFKAGEVVEMSAASAKHWIARKRAELIEGKLSATVAGGVPRQEVVAEMAEQIGELANAEVVGAADVAGADGSGDGDGPGADAGSGDAGASGTSAPATQSRGRRRQ